MVRIIPRICITAFSMSPFDSLSPITASSVATSALHISATRFLNAIIAGSASLFSAVSRYPSRSMNFCHSLTCPWFFDSLLQRNAAHDVLASAFYYRNAGYCFFLYCSGIHFKLHFHEVVVHCNSGPSRLIFAPLHGGRGDACDLCPSCNECASL